MSVASVQHHSVGEAIRATLDPIPWFPVSVAAITMPYWVAWWQTTGSVFGALAQILGALLIAYKLWQAWRDRHAYGKAAKDHIPRTVEAGAKAAVSVGKLTKTGFTLLAITGAVLGFLYWVAHKKREPAAVLPAVTMPVARARRKTKDDAGGDGEAEDDDTDSSNWPKWYRLAYADLGVEEGPGKINNKQVVAYYKDAGHAEVKHDEVPWCAAYVCAMLERAGVSSPKTLAARDFDEWGIEVENDYRPGDVCRFWRESPRSWKGHVGFYAGETTTHIKVLGGNQGDRVSIALFAKSRLVTVRRPRGMVRSKTMWAGGTAATTGAAAAGTAGVAVSGALDDDTSSTLDVATKGAERIAEPLMGSGHPKLMKVALLIVLGCALVGANAGGYAMWRRRQDYRARGF